MFNLFKRQETPKKDFAEELKDLFIIRAATYPCDKCELETKNCKKLIFADRTICVAPANDVSNFRISEKRKSQFLNRQKS